MPGCSNYRWAEALVLFCFSAASCSIGESPNPDGGGYADRIGVDVVSTASRHLSVSIDVDRADASYVVSCVAASEVDGMKDAEMLEMERQWFNSTLDKLGWEQLISKYGGVGSSEKLLDQLQPDSDYCVFAYCIDRNGVVSSRMSKTQARTKGMELHRVGTCIWHDVFASEYNPVLLEGGWNLDLEADLFEEGWDTGLLHVISPYRPENTSDWFGISPETFREKYEDIYWRDADIALDASDPSAVEMKVQDLGISMSSADGWIAAGAATGSTSASVGKLENGVITFPASGMLKSRGLVGDGAFVQANLDGSFRLKINLDQSLL